MGRDHSLRNNKWWLPVGRLSEAGIHTPKEGRGKGLAGSDATDQGREKTPVKVGMAVFLCCEAMIKNHTYPHDGTVGQKSADIGIYQGSRMHCKNGKCGRHPASSRGCCHCSVVTLFSAKLRLGLSILLNPAFQAATTSGLGLAWKLQTYFALLVVVRCCFPWGHARAWIFSGVVVQLWWCQGSHPTWAEHKGEGGLQPAVGGFLRNCQRSRCLVYVLF